MKTTQLHLVLLAVGLVIGFFVLDVEILQEAVERGREPANLPSIFWGLGIIAAVTITPTLIIGGFVGVFFRVSLGIV